ncbi:protein SOB FIVE-LIKE 5 [Humulus lupulus]|uniref:protein SOB FIVE-LIKE 5 n=1 Tax=Humulus lupulus TaxID=3486 RepID=UPI002B40651C|nr:protein SOB FIVE-LIKE 5 [Humulus lupulus]
MDSECSSGCESGWTLYLEQSFLSNKKGSGFLRKSSNFGYTLRDKAGIEQVNEEIDEEEEDLSMVSDASSGPPHYFHHHGQDQQVDYSNTNEDKLCFFNTSKDNVNKFMSKTSTSTSNRKRGTHKIEGRRLRESISCGGDTFLDDTASSPLFNFSNIEDLPRQTNNQTGSTESVLDYSQGFSATHFEERPAFQDSFGFLQQSSLSGNQHHEMSGRLKGRRWK